MSKQEYVAEIKLKYVPSIIKSSIYDKINTSLEAYNFVKSIYNQDTLALHEQFVVVYLNNANNIIGYYNHSKGGISGTVVDVRLIVAVGLKCACSAIIISHNHPSGNLNPSIQDRKQTECIMKALKLFHIVLLDHLILVPDTSKYYSFTDNGDI
jgi:DNA repair protein RadC